MRSLKQVLALIGLAVAVATSATAHAADVARAKLYGATGTQRLVANVNDSYDVTFLLDTGADVVLISLPLAKALAKDGTLTKGEIGEETHVQLAGGQIATGTVIQLRSIAIGNVRVANVAAIVMDDVPKGGMLLGQSFLRRLSGWSIDNRSGEVGDRPLMSRIGDFLLAVAMTLAKVVAIGLVAMNRGDLR